MSAKAPRLAGWLRRLPLFAVAAPGTPPTEPFPVVAWLAAGLALATLPVLDLLPLWLPLAAVGVAAWRLVLARRGAPPPALAVRVGLSLAAVAALAVTGRLGLGVEAALPLFIGFLWIKLLELRGGRRDLLVTAGLGLVLVATTLLVDQSAPAFAGSAAAAAALLAALVRHHSPGGGGRRLWPALRTALALALQGLPLAAVLFLLVPRPDVPVPLLAGSRQAGVGDVMAPGGAKDLANDRQIAFRVQFDGPLPGGVDDLYWRVGVLWRSEDGATWRLPRRALRPQSALAVRIPAGGRLRSYEVTVVVPTMPWAPSLECPVTLAGNTWTPGAAVLEWSQPPGGAFAYRLTSQEGARPDDWNPYIAAAALSPPERVDPRVRALAERLRGGDAGETVERLLAWYRGNRFAYSLDPGSMGGDPLAGFLFVQRRGLCAHYAGASATLLRLAGIPARVVVGYHGAEVNQAGGFLVVRQANAHAWCEVWDAGLERWERVDATAVAPADSAAAATVASRPGAAAALERLDGWRRRWHGLRLWWEVLEARWDRWVMGWSAEQRDDLVAWLGFDQLGRLGLPLLALLAALLAGGLLWWLAHGVPRPRRPDAAERARLLWRECAAVLARCGQAVRPGEGPRDHAERAAAALVAEAATIRAAYAAYERLRYAERPRPDDLPALERATARLAAGELPGRDYSGRRWAVR